MPKRGEAAQAGSGWARRSLSLWPGARRGCPGGHSPSWRRPGAVGAGGRQMERALRPGSAARESRHRHRPSQPPAAVPPALPFPSCSGPFHPPIKLFFFFSNFLGGTERANGRRGRQNKQRLDYGQANRSAEWTRGRDLPLRDSRARAGLAGRAGQAGQADGGGRPSLRLHWAEGTVRYAGDSVRPPCCNTGCGPHVTSTKAPHPSREPPDAGVGWGRGQATQD